MLAKHTCDVKFRKTVDIQLTKEEKNGSIVIRNEVSYSWKRKGIP
ncbi:hypothetical protein [uncultured Catenibacterium sp.]|mgnify:CR=1 FL=1|nr:hypothetical protein [uncultured Catenibacterium sp.]